MKRSMVGILLSGSRSRFLKTGCGIALLVLLTGLMIACGNKPTQQQGPPPPVAVNTVTVQQGNAVYFDVYPATVVALNQVEIRPQVSGYITGIFFQDGQLVQKGQKLYTIDQQQYEGAYQQALANLNVAKANLARTQQDADRYIDLSKQDAIAKQTLDHALADLESSKMQVEAAKANVRSVETNLRYSIIFAPYSGTIGISQVKLGTSVSPGQTLLNTISTDNPIGVDFEVDEKQIDHFMQLKTTGRDIKDSVFTLMMPDRSIYPQPGYISFLDRAVDPQTGTVRARLIFPNPKKSLKPGLTGNLRVLNNGSSTTILIPQKALIEQMAEYFVFVVDSSKVKQRKIVVGARIRDQVVVNSGLSAGEIIVSDGVQKLHDGSAVKLPADSAKNNAPAATK